MAMTQKQYLQKAGGNWNKPKMKAKKKPVNDHDADDMKMKKKSTGKIKTTGSFNGKSNSLGQGGRAAQLKARGVPGGVIGELARRAQAAPGQKNFHKKKGK